MKEELVSRKWLLYALNVFNDKQHGNKDFLNGIETAKELVRDAPAVKNMPCYELMKLRDWLYESDGITMAGLRCMNELLFKYAGEDAAKIETGYERYSE